MKYRKLLILSSAWMIGIALRFLYMLEINTYTFSLFDKIFDWGGLFVFGITLFYVTIFDYLEEKKNEKNSFLFKT